MLRGGVEVAGAVAEPGAPIGAVVVVVVVAGCEQAVTTKSAIKDLFTRYSTEVGANLKDGKNGGKKITAICEHRSRRDAEAGARRN